ncbi:MAG TPA: sigma-70 family RNA polymerase sigma factor [Methylomirabilota bacterium]|nr:sigma-70 family RNA polymerase sigma factor [Methylomirabilota bacterium]
MGLGADDPSDLIKRIAQGDRESFGRFYDLYAPLVFTLATRVLRSRTEAEDLLQDVFLQAWRQAGSYEKGRGSPEAWLITITRSRAIDKLRSVRRRDKGIVPSDDPAYSETAGRVESGEKESEAKVMVGSALARLPDAQARVLELAYFDGMSQSEIAARLGEPLGTVKTRMRDGLERLRGFLGAKRVSGVS